MIGFRVSFFRLLVAAGMLTAFLALPVNDSYGKESSSKMIPVDSVCADFSEFVSLLENTHPDPYTPFGGRPFFMKRVQDIRSSLKRDSVSTAEELAQRISQLIATLRDGHTYVNIPFKNISDPRFLPVRFRNVSNSILIRGTTDSLKHLIGARVKVVNGMDIEEVKERLSSYVTAENESGAYENVRYYLNDERYLSRLFPGENLDNVLFELQLPDDSTMRVYIPLLPYEKLIADKVVFADSDIQLPDKNMEWTILEGEGSPCYFRFKSVNSRDNFAFMRDRGMDFKSQLQYYLNAEGEEMPDDINSAIESLPVAVDIFGEMLKEMKKRESRSLIIDLRGNGGGWTPIVYPMLYQLFGKDMLDLDRGISFCRKISPLYLEKMNMTLSNLSDHYGKEIMINDYIFEGGETWDKFERDSEALDREVDNMMTLNSASLKALGGEAIYTPENIYVVIDGSTFSAAFHTAFYLWKLGAKTVGVASSQAPNTYMESTPFRLKRSGLTGSISNYLQLFLPATDKNARQLEPDVKLDYNLLRKYSFDPNAEIIMLL